MVDEATVAAAPAVSGADDTPSAKNKPKDAQAQPAKAAKSASAADVKPARKPRDNTPKSMPFFEQKVMLNTFHAQQIFNRTYGVGDEALFTLSVILRALAPEGECVKVDDMTEKLLADTKKLIDDERIRLEKLADSYGIALTSMSYSAPKEVAVKITSPRALIWMSVISDFDRLVERFDLLWFSQAIKNGDYSGGIQKTKAKIRRLANELRTLAIRSMAAAQRQSAEEIADPRNGTALDTNHAAAPAEAQGDSPDNGGVASASANADADADAATEVKAEAEAEAEAEAIA